MVFQNPFGGNKNMQSRSNRRPFESMPIPKMPESLVNAGKNIRKQEQQGLAKPMLFREDMNPFEGLTGQLKKSVNEAAERSSGFSLERVGNALKNLGGKVSESFIPPEAQNLQNFQVQEQQDKISKTPSETNTSQITVDRRGGYVARVKEVSVFETAAKYARSSWGSLVKLLAFDKKTIKKPIEKQPEPVDTESVPLLSPEMTRIQGEIDLYTNQLKTSDLTPTQIAGLQANLDHFKQQQISQGVKESIEEEEPILETDSAPEVGTTLDTASRDTEKPTARELENLSKAKQSLSAYFEQNDLSEQQIAQLQATLQEKEFDSIKGILAFSEDSRVKNILGDSDIQLTDATNRILYNTNTLKDWDESFEERLAKVMDKRAELAKMEASKTLKDSVTKLLLDISGLKNKADRTVHETLQKTALGKLASKNWFLVTRLGPRAIIMGVGLALGLGSDALHGHSHIDQIPHASNDIHSLLDQGVTVSHPAGYEEYLKGEHADYSPTFASSYQEYRTGERDGFSVLHDQISSAETVVKPKPNMLEGVTHPIAHTSSEIGTASRTEIHSVTGTTTPEYRSGETTQGHLASEIEVDKRAAVDGSGDNDSITTRAETEYVREGRTPQGDSQIDTTENTRDHAESQYAAEARAADKIPVTSPEDQAKPIVMATVENDIPSAEQIDQTKAEVRATVPDYYEPATIPELTGTEKYIQNAENFYNSIIANGKAMTQEELNTFNTQFAQVGDKWAIINPENGNVLKVMP
jgi:hypothetical protein